MQETQKFLIDTDLGDDIDDALALSLALSQGMELVGITTVFRNVEDRARMAKNLLCAFGEPASSIPVLCGHALPIDAKTPSAAVDFLTPDERTDPALAPDSTEPDAAVDFIIHACRTYGKSLTVVALGPLTNLARVIERDPDALSSASCVAMMGGSFFSHYADWNVSCDPQAAARVFSSLPNLLCVGADVTHRTVASPHFEAQLLHPSPDAPPWRHYLASLSHRWEQTRAKPCLVLHDPLLVAYLLDPSLLRFSEAAVTVVTDGPARGLTLNLDAYEKAWMNPSLPPLSTLPRHRLAYALELDRFFAWMDRMIQQ